MKNKINNLINTNFTIKERKIVIEHLSSICLDHVMANSEYNLLNTRFAVLKLAKGSMNDLIRFIERAKIDFRDVIMWATEDENNKYP